jgi:hypothetical protein
VDGCFFDFVLTSGIIGFLKKKTNQNQRTPGYLGFFFKILEEFFYLQAMGF